MKDGERDSCKKVHKSKADMDSYRWAMDDEQHIELLQVLMSHKGKVLISGYDNEIYSDMLADWQRQETTCYSQVCSKKKEVLWMNFEPNRQITLF